MRFARHLLSLFALFLWVSLLCVGCSNCGTAGQNAGHVIVVETIDCGPPALAKFFACYSAHDGQCLMTAAIELLACMAAHPPVPPKSPPATPAPEAGSGSATPAPEVGSGSAAVMTSRWDTPVRLNHGFATEPEFLCLPNVRSARTLPLVL